MNHISAPAMDPCQALATGALGKACKTGGGRRAACFYWMIFAHLCLFTWLCQLIPAAAFEFSLQSFLILTELLSSCPLIRAPAANATLEGGVPVTWVSLS